MARRLTPDIVETYAKLADVPVPLALAIWSQESDTGKNTKTSPKGAVGDFQLMPATFKRYMPNGNINDPVDNMQAGLAVLRDNLQRYGGDWEKAAQAYYHGQALGGAGEGPTSGPGTPTVRRYGQSVLAKANKYAQDRGENTLASLATPSAGTTATADLFGAPPPTTASTALPDLGSPDNMAGFTQPLGGYAPTSFSTGPNDLAVNEMGSRDYEMDRYIRKIVDEELKPNA